MPKKSEIFYNENNTCDNCKNKLIVGKTYKEYNKQKWTGRYLCINCWRKIYYKHIEKENQHSFYNVMKRMKDSRINNLDPNSSHGKGYIYEQITARTRNIKNLNVEEDNFNFPIDHIDPEYGILQSKGTTYNILEKRWNTCWINEQKKEFDNLILYCLSKDGKNVERVYIIPNKEVLLRTGLTIVKYPTKKRFIEQWYEKYRVDEKPYNDVYHKILDEINNGNDPIIRKCRIIY